MEKNDLLENYLKTTFKYKIKNDRLQIKSRTKYNNLFFINKINNEFIVTIDTNKFLDKTLYNKCEKKIIEYLGYTLRYNNSPWQFIFKSELEFNKLMEILKTFDF